jgi:hypothetical protein
MDRLAPFAQKKKKSRIVDFAVIFAQCGFVQKDQVCFWLGSEPRMGGWKSRTQKNDFPFQLDY